MTHPFEDDEQRYLVLRQADGQYSLWPFDLDLPDGWAAVSGPDSRAACRTYVEQHWVSSR